MLTWILAVLGLYFVQTLITPFIRIYLSRGTLPERIWRGFGPRDDLPPPTVAAGRAGRALKNLQEALPLFLTFALLAMILGRDQGLTNLGARMFFAFRLIYVPTYLIGVPVLRTVLWLGGHLGLLLMLVGLLR